jgi:hypothetical protein
VTYTPAESSELVAPTHTRGAHVGVVIITVAVAALAVGVFLPWYTLWAEQCGEHLSLAVSQISGGGWRLDLLLCGLVTWVSVLSDVNRFRMVTIVGAWVSLLLALTWWGKSPVLSLRGVCTKAFHGPLTLQYGHGTGVGVYLGIGAGLAMVYGAHLRSRRIKSNTAK